MKMKRTDMRTRNIVRRVVSSKFYLFIYSISFLDGGFAFGSALHVSLLLRGNFSLIGRWFSFFCHPRPISVDYIICAFVSFLFYFL